MSGDARRGRRSSRCETGRDRSGEAFDVPRLRPWGVPPIRHRAGALDLGVPVRGRPGALTRSRCHRRSMRRRCRRSTPAPTAPTCRATLTTLYRHGIRSPCGDLNRFLTARVLASASRLNAPSQPTASGDQNINSRTPRRPVRILTSDRSASGCDPSDNPGQRGACSRCTAGALGQVDGVERPFITRPPAVTVLGLRPGLSRVTVGPWCSG